MKVEIQALFVGGDGVSRVRVATPIGEAELVLGSRAPVSVGRRCDAELAVEVSLRRGTNVWPSEPGAHRLATVGDVTTLAGHVESVEPDGVVILGLARDLLVMIEAEPDAVMAGEWVRVELPSRAVSIYLTP